MATIKEKPNALCPKCQVKNARRIVGKGVVDWFMQMLGMVPYHCQNCYGKFHAPKIEKEVKGEQGSGT